LFDAAGSVGANRAESKSSYSDQEFASKNAICLKECREARFWLLVAIYVTSVRKLQAKLNT
jgi:four helix bundle protein